MKKAIAICFFLWCGLTVSVVSLIGLCLMGPALATAWGLAGTLLAAPPTFTT